MKIHYFQRYHGKENMATANTMLLLSRLYSYSPDKFFKFLKSEYFNNSFEPELVFTLQEKSSDSRPDATITQEGFKIVVETKLTDWFYSEQLMRHLESFGNVKNKFMITLSSELMSEEKRSDFEKQLKEYNSTQEYPVIHINTTFEKMANAISEVIDDRDYEMRDILDDYQDYCYKDKLISGADSWKQLRMQLTGTTFDFNIGNNVYYDNADRGFRPHDYLGLYKQKSVRAIGKISARITAVETETGIKYASEFGELTEERKQMIEKAIKDAESYGYDLRTVEHRYFFVEQFYETDFKKITPGGSMGTKFFDLSEILNIPEINKMPDTEKIAELLKDKTWN